MSRRQLPTLGRYLAHFTLLAVALIAWACATTPPRDAVEPAAPPAPTGNYFLTLSDIHFDPYYDKSLVEQLFDSEAAGWQAIFETSSVTTLMDPAEARHEQDTSYPLFRSALAAVAAEIEKLPGQEVDYVLITGDFLAHDFDATFKELFPDKGFDDYRGFVLKTMTFLRDELAAAFPATPVFPTLGNNDAACGDYGLAPGSGFMADTAALWQPLIGQPIADFSQTGSYTVPHPVVPDFDYVMLNDIPFSILYAKFRFAYPNPACDAATGGLPATEQAWLKDQLGQATGRVALAFHIPPGISQYRAARDEEDDEAAFRTAMCSAANCDPAGTCDCETIDDVDTDLACDQEDAFIDTVGANVDKLGYIMAAHSHQDDFRVYQIPRPGGGDDSVPVLVHLNPSISISNGNNPGFQIFTYDAADGTLLDYTTHYLANLETAGSNGPGDPAPSWQKLYTFSEGYIAAGGLPAGSYDAAAVNGLLARLRADPAFAAQTYRPWHALNATVSGAAEIDDEDWDVYLCTLDKLTKAEFAACYCMTGT